MDQSLSSKPSSELPIATRAVRWRATCAAALLTMFSLASHAGTREVLMWSAEDCSWCTVWKKSDRVAEFQAAAEPLSIRLFTVSKRSLASPSRTYVFPEGATNLSVDQAPTLLPAFDFVCDGKSVRRLQGMDAWDSHWSRQLRQLAKDCPVAPVTAQRQSEN